MMCSILCHTKGHHINEKPKAKIVRRVQYVFVGWVEGSTERIAKAIVFSLPTQPPNLD